MAIQKKGTRRSYLKPVVIASILLLNLSSAGICADILIIANQNVPETALDPDHVQDIFLGKRVFWQDHSKISVFVLDDPDIHKQFLDQYVHKTINQWKEYWTWMVFTGRELPPESLSTASEMIDIILRTKSAIGYVPSGALGDNAKHNGLKILETEK